MKQKGIGTVMAEKTQVYHFAPGMPYIPPKDFRLVRAKWESPQLYINGLPAFFHLHLQREDGYYSYAQIFCRPVVNNKQLNIRQIGYVNTSDIGKSLEKMADFHQYQEYFLTANSFSTPKERKKKNLYTIQNIVLDIDIHSAKRDRGIFIQRFRMTSTEQSMRCCGSMNVEKKTLIKRSRKSRAAEKRFMIITMMQIIFMQLSLNNIILI